VLSFYQINEECEIQTRDCLVMKALIACVRCCDDIFTSSMYLANMRNMGRQGFLVFYQWKEGKGVVI